jgi:5-hydroxyisourate hydrolase
MSAITTHVLDTSAGRPAAGITVTLARRGDDGRWATVAEATTDADGRVADLLGDAAIKQAEMYRLRFALGEYFGRHRTPAFYPYADVVFTTRPGQHYHVPLLVSPFGYSTYRGQ